MTEVSPITTPSERFSTEYSGTINVSRLHPGDGYEGPELIRIESELLGTLVLTCPEAHTLRATLDHLTGAIMPADPDGVRALASVVEARGLTLEELAVVVGVELSDAPTVNEVAGLAMALGRWDSEANR